MSQAFSYLLLQWKRCLRTLGTSLCILLGIGVLIGGSTYVVMKNLEVKGLSLIRIGIVLDEEETSSMYVTKVISSMDSVRSICSFEYFSEEEALNKYKEGELQAVVVMPAGFYHDVQVGLNPPAIIYVPEDGGLVVSMFTELLRAGVSYLQTAEAGVYATIDTTREYGSVVADKDIGNTIAIKYVNVIFARDNMFGSTEVLPFSNLSVGAYYMMSALVILMMFTGIIFFRMYQSNNKAVDNMLKIRGINSIVCGVLKIVVMIPVIYILGMCIFEFLLWISGRTNLKYVVNSPSVWSWMVVISVTMSLYFHLIYALTGDGVKGLFVLVILNILCSVISGLVIPSIYMADWTQKIGRFTPPRFWMMLLSYALTGQMGGAL